MLKEYTDSLAETTGHIALIADKDNDIAVSGTSKKEFLNKPIGPALEKVMEDRKVTLINNPGAYKQCKGCVTDCDEEDGICKFTCEVIAPIIVEAEKTIISVTSVAN